MAASQSTQAFRSSTQGLPSTQGFQSTLDSSSMQVLSMMEAS